MSAKQEKTKIGEMGEVKDETHDGTKEKIVYCADVIALYGDKIVIVERLGSVRGLALPGGKQDPGESLSETVTREFYEETGMTLVLEVVFGTYAEQDRDPRGRYVSTVFTGTATGNIRDEREKTKVVLLSRDEVLDRKNDFVFDHGKILETYLTR